MLPSCLQPLDGVTGHVQDTVLALLCYGLGTHNQFNQLLHTFNTINDLIKHLENCLVLKVDKWSFRLTKEYIGGHWSSSNFDISLGCKFSTETMSIYICRANLNLILILCPRFIVSRQELPPWLMENSSVIRVGQGTTFLHPLFLFLGHVSLEL